jgi:hypothetical protein
LARQDSNIAQQAVPTKKKNTMKKTHSKGRMTMHMDAIQAEELAL